MSPVHLLILAAIHGSEGEIKKGDFVVRDGGSGLNQLGKKNSMKI